MALVPNNTLITPTPEEGRELAVILARKPSPPSKPMKRSARVCDPCMPMIPIH